jgi:hypothetical protein
MGAPGTILLRSSWQTVNIGDIAHTPGMLALLERHLPDTRVILWYSSVDRGVAEMLKRRFPGLRMIPAKPDSLGPNDLSIQEAFAEADLLLHGSGPAFAGFIEVKRWVAETAKPWGAAGVTLQSPPTEQVDVLKTAQFLYTRETHSLDHLRRSGVTEPFTDFAPDATFACDLRRDDVAEAFLRNVGLLDNRFICVIPRYRKTPYYRIHPSNFWTPERIREVDELNNRWAELDHAKLREVITRYVRSTGGRVLLCSEMEYQVALQKPLLFDALPDDVKPNVINRVRYWLTDEAASVYRHAEALIGFECHSPILCAARGVTGFYVRQPEDTIKGQMYYDLKLDDRVAEVDEVDGKSLADKFMRLIDDPESARARLDAAMETARARMLAPMLKLKGLQYS